MKYLIAGLVLGVLIGSAVNALARPRKIESSSHDAMSIVGYGKNAGNILILKTDSQGRLQLP